MPFSFTCKYSLLYCHCLVLTRILKLVNFHHWTVPHLESHSTDTGPVSAFSSEVIYVEHYIFLSKRYILSIFKFDLSFLEDNNKYN